MDNSILAALEFDGARGALLYSNVRYLLIRPETLMAFQKATEKMLGTEADRLLYEGGFAGGALSARKYREAFGQSGEESVEFMAKMGTEIGWGKMFVTNFSASGGELELTVEGSPFASAYGKADRGVCHLIRGVFAGLASDVFARPVESHDDATLHSPGEPGIARITASEVDCLAMGSPCCRFSIRAIRKDSV
jgi:predicted hydrocarbon binding protein